MAIKKRQTTNVKRQTLLSAKLQFVFSIFLILVGISLIGYATSKNFNLGTQQPKNPTTQEPVQKPQYSKIESINIPKIKRDLVVEDGVVSGNRWQVSAEGVSFYTDSSLPEEGGNTVLYGHNKARILGGLVDMKVGDKIELTLENGKMLAYEVTEVKTIKPSDVDILNQTSEPRLTIYTCTGFLDTARFVVISKLVTG